MKPTCRITSSLPSSGALEVLVPWGPALLVLIDSLIRNEQQRLVLWIIVIFVTLRTELRG